MLDPRSGNHQARSVRTENETETKSYWGFEVKTLRTLGATSGDTPFWKNTYCYGGLILLENWQSVRVSSL